MSTAISWFVEVKVVDGGVRIFGVLQAERESTYGVVVDVADMISATPFINIPLPNKEYSFSSCLTSGVLFENGD